MLLEQEGEWPAPLQSTLSASNFPQMREDPGQGGEPGRASGEAFQLFPSKLSKVSGGGGGQGFPLSPSLEGPREPPVKAALPSTFRLSIASCLPRRWNNKASVAETGRDEVIPPRRPARRGSLPPARVPGLPPACPVLGDSVTGAPCTFLWASLQQEAALLPRRQPLRVSSQAREGLSLGSCFFSPPFPVSLVWRAKFLPSSLPAGSPSPEQPRLRTATPLPVPAPAPTEDTCPGEVLQGPSMLASGSQSSAATHRLPLPSLLPSWCEALCF